MKNNQKVISTIALLALMICLIASIPAASATYVAFNKQHTPGGTLLVGESKTFTITLDVKTDVGGSQIPLTTVSLVDTLPLGLTYVVGSQTSTPAAASFNAVGKVLTWTWAGTLSGSPQVTVTFVATADGEDIGTVRNEVSAHYLENGELQSDPSASDTVVIIEPQPTTPPPSLPPPPPVVGGESMPVNILQVISPYIIVALFGAIAVVTIVLYKKRTA